MNIASCFFTTARRMGNARAVTDDFRSTDFAAMAYRVGGLAGALRSRLGLTTGDRVVLCLENSADCLEVMFACWTAGLVVVPVNIKLHPLEIAYIADNAAARLMICSKSLADTYIGTKNKMTTVEHVLVVGTPDYEVLVRRDAIPPQPSLPDDLAWIFYTSGTTGRPKGAMLSHRNLLFMSMCYYADVESVSPGDTGLHFLPLSHGAGLYALPHLLRGGHQVIQTGSFDPGRVFDALSQFENVTFFAVPTVMKRLVEAREANETAARNLKTLWYGGAPPYVADIRKALDLFGPKLIQLFGQGESPCTITGMGKDVHADVGHPQWQERMRSCGYARTGVAVRVVDAEDRELPIGEVGEIVTRSDCVMTGYWKNPDASAETLRNGWLHTGDLGSLDVDGYLTLTDRSKDVIISGGSNIYPREIEEVLQRHDDIAEVAVIGRKSDEWGEEVVAMVVPRSGVTIDPEKLNAHCAEHIAKYKRPQTYHVLSELPKSGYGKILKSELRGMLADIPD